MSLASELFETLDRAVTLEDEVGDELLRRCGINPDTPNEWPLGNIVFDSYDYSFEFHRVDPNWRMTAEQWAACQELGFARCWVCYTDGRESYCAGPPTAVVHPREHSELFKRVRVLVKQREAAMVDMAAHVLEKVKRIAQS
jgi:hypothetical protein